VRIIHVPDQVVDIIAFDMGIIPVHIDAVDDMVNVVPQERAVTDNALAGLAQTVELAVLDDSAGYALLDVDDREAGAGDLAVLDRDIVCLNVDSAANIKA